jgi:uncharacterized membrane protein (UPF0127 family)
MTTDIHLDGPLARARGVIGRYPAEDERYIFRFDEPQQLGVHMLGVCQPLLVEWLLEDDVVESQVLRPWVGHARARADTVVEQRPRAA